MQYFRALQRRTLAIGLFTSLSVCAQTAAPGEIQGISARAGAADYQAQAKIGKFTIAADFVGHAIPTMQGPLFSEDYVAVEVAYYGVPGSRVVMSWEHFSLRINGKKSAIPSRPYGLVTRSLSDPEWIPPKVDDGGGSKGGISTGGGGGAGAPKPDPPKMPFPLKRAMEQRALKSALPAGERPVPEAGLLIFPYRGKDDSIHEVELIYEGPDGNATLNFPR